MAYIAPIYQPIYNKSSGKTHCVESEMLIEGKVHKVIDCEELPYEATTSDIVLLLTVLVAFIGFCARLFKE